MFFCFEGFKINFHIFACIMAGLYIHIPFCKRRCVYCDFYSNTDMSLKDRYIDALIDEMKVRRDAFLKEPVTTLYFGGGTPSQLNEDDFSRIFRTISELCSPSVWEEITIEANPDDLSLSYIRMLGKFPFNRISIGVQSFHDADLLFLNRRHTAAQAIEAVRNCRAAGLDNISIDLMYGLPGQTLEQWDENLSIALRLQPYHLSCYHLIYEEGTVLCERLHAGSIQEVSEEDSVAMFSLLIDRLQEAGYEHYEISNFALAGFRSRHNSSYWNDKPYIGIGASAHSYNMISRQWNVSDIREYVRQACIGKFSPEQEIIDGDTRYNDIVITALRTSDGLDVKQLERRFGKKRAEYCLEQAEPFIASGKLILENGNMRLSRSGIFVSDSIMSALMFVGDKD